MKKLNLITLVAAKLTHKPVICFDTVITDFYGYKRLYHSKSYYLAAADTTETEIRTVENKIYQSLYEKWNGLQFPDITITGNVPALSR